MWLISPILILLMASLAIIISQRIRPGPGYAWIIAIAASFISWVFLLVMHWVTPVPLSLEGWSLSPKATELISLEVDLISWPYAFSLSTILLAVIMTSATRIQGTLNPIAWAGCLVISGFGILAVLGRTALTLVLAWTLLDLIELIILIVSVRDTESTKQAVSSFSVKTLGSLVMIYAMVLSIGQGQILTLDQIMPGNGIFLLIAVGLRLGVIPRHLPLSGESELRRDLGTLIRLAGPSSSLMVLGHLPGVSVPSNLYPFIIFIVVAGSIYSSLMWLISKDELISRPYWMIAIAGLAVVCVLKGASAASIAWGVIMILSGGLLFLYSSRQASLYFLPVFGLVSILGLPFSPSSSAWQGVMSPFDLAGGFLLITYVFLSAGYFRHAFSPGESFKALDRWAQIIYPAGLTLIVISQWLINVVGWPGSFTWGAWKVIIPTALVLSALSFLFYRRGNNGDVNSLRTWHKELGTRIGRPLTNFFSLNWLNALPKWIYKGAAAIVYFVSAVLEGDGGILWALLIVALLTTFFIPGIMP